MNLGAVCVLESDAPELGIYILQGAVRLSDQRLVAGELVLLDDGNRIELEVEGEQEVELALIGGEPAKGEILFSGPFVMDTRERLTQAKRDFSAGRMGRLDGVPF